MSEAPESMLSGWVEQVREAAARGQVLCLRGGGSKDFYGGELAGAVFDTRAYAGIVNYEPSELVLTARCGTSLAEIEAVLAGNGQHLPFEPPRFGEGATVGGCVATGLSGPARMRRGSLRDFVLGVRVMDGQGRILRFGGQVMKNVAGYDVSRLFAGSLGTLGVILEASFKLLPLPPAERTLVFEMAQTDALDRLRRWSVQPLPLTASAWHDGRLLVRLAGAVAAVEAASRSLGGECLSSEQGKTYWFDLREQRLPFFAGDVSSGAPSLWRLAVPPSALLPELGEVLIEWGGAQRWLRGGDATQIRAVARAAGGHATLFRADSAIKSACGAFQPLVEPLAGLHYRLKRVFDPQGLFNRGRLYPDL